MEQLTASRSAATNQYSKTAMRALRIRQEMCRHLLIAAAKAAAAAAAAAAAVLLLAVLIDSFLGSKVQDTGTGTGIPCILKHSGALVTLARYTTSCVHCRSRWRRLRCRRDQRRCRNRCWSRRGSRCWNRCRSRSQSRCRGKRWCRC